MGMCLGITGLRRFPGEQSQANVDGNRHGNEMRRDEVPAAVAGTADTGSRTAGLRARGGCRRAGTGPDPRAEITAIMMVRRICMAGGMRCGMRHFLAGIHGHGMRQCLWRRTGVIGEQQDSAQQGHTKAAEGSPWVAAGSGSHDTVNRYYFSNIQMLCFGIRRVNPVSLPLPGETS